MFKRIETDEALISERGVYKPAEVYEGPDSGLYVAAKGGFVRVRENGGTSSPSVNVVRLHREDRLFRDQFGRICVDPGSGRQPLKVAGSEADALFLPAPDAWGRGLNYTVDNVGYVV